MYARCLAPEFTFQPDTRVSKYYYQRLEAKDPAYQHKTMPFSPVGSNNNSTLHGGVPPRYGSVGRRGGENSHSRAGGHHQRNHSADGRVMEKERLHRSLKKSATLSNDLFDPDSGTPFTFHPKVGRGPRNQHRPDPKKQKGATA